MRPHTGHFCAVLAEYYLGVFRTLRVDGVNYKVSGNFAVNISELWTVAGGLAAIIAIVAGLYGAYEFVCRRLAARPYRKSLSIFAGDDAVKNDLLKMRGRTVNFDTWLDFSIWNEFTHRIVSETEYGDLLDGTGSNLNKQPLPLYIQTEHGTLDSFARVIVNVRDSDRLKFSHGGTGVIQVLLKGRFEVEARWYSGPSVEITLREVTSR